MKISKPANIFVLTSYKYLCVAFLFTISITISPSIAKPMELKHSKYIVDIYGTRKISLSIINKKYEKELQQIAAVMLSKSDINSPSNNKIMADSISKITNGIQSTGNFSYVGISPIMYQNNNIIYITIDIVDESDKRRSTYFLPIPTQTINGINDLIAKWQEYENIGFSLAFKSKKFPSFITCPAYHCVFGFDHPALKNYLYIFTSQVEKNKITLMNVLKNDKDENKRATAAYLLAHMKNGNELINILIPSIYDPSPTVRNTLIQELKMQQINVHDLAYVILKKISAKNYSERDYKSWKNWLNEAKYV